MGALPLRQRSGLSMIFLTYLREIGISLLLIFFATQMPEFGKFLLLGAFAVIGLLILRYSRVFVDALLRWWWLLAMPALCVASAFWSDQPIISARYALQFLFTCIVGVALARMLKPDRYIVVILVALFVFCVLSILSGRQGASATGPVLIGLTGAKNQMAYIAQMLMLAAIAVLLMRDVARPVRWLAVVALPLSIALVVGTNATTAVLMAVAGSGLLIVLWLLQRLTPGGRIGVVAFALLVLVPISALTPEITEIVNEFLYDTLDKDPTLTGRTHLWERADALIAQRPLFGFGYQAIWLGDSTETIALKRLTGIEDGRLFHFHHQLRQIAVDTGLLGAGAFVAALVVVTGAYLRRAFLAPDVATSFFFVTFILMVLRSFTDVVVVPFGLHTLFFFACGVYAFWRPEHAAQQRVLLEPLWAPRRPLAVGA